MKTHRILLASLSLAIVAAANAQVYTQTNEAGGNRLVELKINSDGSLSGRRFFNTGGLGTSASLGIQGAVAISDDHKFLFVVNAGSNDVSTFLLAPEGPRFVSRVASQGVAPVSVTSQGSLVYVLNGGGGAPGIAGFRLSDNGTLTPIANSVRALSRPDAAPGQIGINPEGDTVYVTQKNTNRIDYFSIDSNGAAGQSSWLPSPGPTPFGFAFGRRGKLIVSEAFGGAPNGSAVTAYNGLDSGLPQIVGASIPTFQTAACWVATSVDKRFAYVANAGSDSVTGYRIYDDGSLAILNVNGVTGKTTTGAGATDLVANASNLYVLAPRKGYIASFAIAQDGKLTKLATAVNLPTTITGIAVK